MTTLEQLSDAILWRRGPKAVAELAHELFLANAEVWESDEPIWDVLHTQAPLHIPDAAQRDRFLQQVHEIYETLM